MTAQTFSSVLIKPKYSKVKSRQDIPLTSDFGPFKLNLPVFSANMKDITGPAMCEAMHASGGMGILHRFNTVEDAVKDYEDAVGRILKQHKDEQFKSQFDQKMVFARDLFDWINHYSVGVSIGVNFDEDIRRAIKLYDAGARIFSIDIAHGHSEKMRDMIIGLRSALDAIHTPYIHTPYIIAGNIATREAAIDLAEWGASCVKIGIGPGSVCQTRNNTGAGVPQLYAIQEAKAGLDTCKRDVQMIADGGIKTTGDIVKALAYADAVMLGSFLSGTIETPGHVYEDPEGNYYKIFGGSASGENKVNNGKNKQFVEGVVKMVPFRGHVKYILKKIHENVQSGISYGGGHDLLSFKHKVEFIEIGEDGRNESKIKG